MNIEEIKTELARQEKALANSRLFALMGEKIQLKVDGLKNQLSEAIRISETNIIKIPSTSIEVEVCNWVLFQRPITWHNAKKKCEVLGDGWRLPTVDELEVMYKHKDIIGHFIFPIYWSSERFNALDAYTFGGFQSGTRIGRMHRTFDIDCGARAVRTI